MENKDLHTKIEQTLQSLEGIKRAEANPFLLTRVIEGINKAHRPLFSYIRVWQVAASILLVLGLNLAIELYTLKQINANNPTTESGYFNNHVYTY